jgi:hypothetical protein
MLRLAILLSLLCGSCGAVSQPNSLQTVAAFEVPLPTDADKLRFLGLLREVAGEQGYHVDASSPSELRQMSKVSPITFSAAVWRGNDEESIASAMDFKDNIGRIWITFSLGENPKRSTQFREVLMQKIRESWPSTTALPIMPSGSIPLADDLTRTPSGYVVKPSEAYKYQHQTKL